MPLKLWAYKEVLCVAHGTSLVSISYPGVLCPNSVFRNDYQKLLTVSNGLTGA